MTRFSTVTGLVLGLVMFAGCAPETQLIELKTGRSQIRDVVRTAAVLPDGSPVFDSLDNDYQFVGEVFHIEGTYTASGGDQHDGYLELGFDVADGELVASVGSDVSILEGHLPYLARSLADELDRSVRDKFEEEVLEFEKVEVLADNVLEISFRLDRSPIRGG